MGYAEDAALITRTLALYCQLLDDLRFADWAELFTDDAEWKTPFSCFRGRAAIVEGLRGMEPEARGWVKHLTYSPIIEVDSPATARAWSDLVALVRDRESGAWSIAASGRYYDVLQKDGGLWRFKSRAADIDVADSPLPGLARFRGRRIACAVRSMAEKHLIMLFALETGGLDGLSGVADDRVLHFAQPFPVEPDGQRTYG